MRSPLFVLGLALATTPLAIGCASNPPAEAKHEGHGHEGHGHEGHGMPHRFEKAEDWAKVFDAEDRDAWQKPEEVIAALGLTDASLVADVGAGTGYFAAKIAKRVPAGKVFAIDVEADMVRYLGERKEREKLSNLVPVLAAPDDPKIPEPVDVVLVVDTIHHIDHREPYFAKLRAALKPGGRVVIVDFHEDAKKGPPRKHRLSSAQVSKEAEAGGLVRKSEARLPEQYVLVLVPR